MPSRISTDLCQVGGSQLSSQQGSVKPPSQVLEFISALADRYTYNPFRNAYIIFGFIWGIPIPFFSVGIDIFVAGRVFSLQSFLMAFSEHPIHHFFAIHPIIFAIVFGTMGTVRYRKDCKIDGLINELKGNVEQLARANEKLKELDKLKSDFVANITHELKTPLVAIRGYSEMLQEGRLGNINDKQKDGLGTIIRNVDRFQKMVEDLLQLAKIDSGKLVLNKARFDIRDVVSTALIPFQPQIVGKRLNVENAFPEGDTVVYADMDKILHVLTNLISNAVKFTMQEGTIGIDIKSNSDSRVTITVWDTGCGVTEEQQKHLFERFWQADNSATRKHSGSGLGLPIVKGILDAHNSTIRVLSVPNSGSKITFDLPLAEVNLSIDKILRGDVWK
ncbi:MAG: hypothetical protein A2W05_11685 [Candidatus Schekmanbacteria bacterium RBG_16_38_10]|uniref:histidine kinase n=1 Tax=Candidatus Schekmanbacteria bacterium RBG_16_38_10 TaxID=1817879 RepID=A0A1F7RV19_9BACT|nr:MAG: hypothetical protein A2W05_11685 [Candidatus Schekmanbacteria bacterium RBG_16_38_10]